jgi:hypothetical protein
VAGKRISGGCKIVIDRATERSEPLGITEVRQLGCANLLGEDGDGLQFFLRFDIIKAILHE